MTFSRPFFLSALTTVCAFALVGSARADSTPATPVAWSIATGFDYSRGDYGFTTDTEVLSVPLNLNCDTGAWLFSLSVPWIHIKGPAANTGAGGAARPTASAESGLGDIYAGATYRFGETLGPVNLAFTGRVKLPTADEDRGLGTGEFDYYGQFDFYHTVGAFTPFASLGYRLLGDSALYALENGVYAAAGTHYRASDQLVWTLAANWGQRIVAGGDATTDVTLAFTRDLSAQWQLSGYVLKGFTDASPDVGAGLQVSYRY